VEHAGQRSAVNLRPNEAETAGEERPDAGAARTADRHADNDVAHQVDDAVAAEVVLRSEEAGAEAEAQLAADHAVAHATRVHTKPGAAVVKVSEPCDGIRSDPRAHITFRVGRRWRQKRHDKG